MSDLNDLIQMLAGPLRLESRKSYADTAVLGTSIGVYARQWARRAQRVVTDPARKAICRKIRDTLSDYASSDAQGRRRRAEEALRLLSDLAPGKGGAAPPPGREKPASEDFDLDAPLAAGRRAGAAWVKRLAKVGIETNRDLLYHLPRQHLPVRRLADLVDGERAAVVAETGLREESVARAVRGARLMRYALEITDGSARAWVTSFARLPRRGARSRAIANSPLTLNHPPNTRLLVEGAVRRAGSLIEIQFGGSQRLEGDDQVGPGDLVPVYPLTDGVYQSQVRPAVRQLLAALPSNLPDPLPARLRKQQGLPGLAEALGDLHWPRSEQAKEAAQRRLAFEELLVLQLALAQRKRELQRPGSGLAMRPRGDVVAMLEEFLPFSLTRAQQRVIGEVASEMALDVPMTRMIQGDVGSGKTVVAAAAMAIAAQNACQGVLMAPTELLAEQHYLSISLMLAPFGMSVELLTGSVRGKARESAYARIADGRAQLVVGTHALIQEGLEFHRPGLVIVDEQHRFGVRERADLLGKGQRPDMLVMTATPIPRTLALTLYGDLDISVLDEMPPGRTPVNTSWLPLHRQHEAHDLVRREVAAGRQAYVVCPLIEESEKLQAEAAVQLKEQLETEVFPDLRVGLLHGAMKVTEKEAVMSAFRAGEIDVLTATTVVEVGVDVPNATVMLILNAERFGLAQLHQLRGRVGRGGQASYCVLLTDRRYDPTGRVRPQRDDSLEQTQARLRTLIEETDGFAIAEEDLRLRGPGEFYGTRQHGLPDLRLARMARETGVLEEAREAALRIVESDLSLAAGEHAGLRESVGLLRARMDRVAV